MRSSTNGKIGSTNLKKYNIHSKDKTIVLNSLNKILNILNDLNAFVIELDSLYDKQIEIDGRIAKIEQKNKTFSFISIISCLFFIGVTFLAYTKVITYISLGATLCFGLFLLVVILANIFSVVVLDKPIYKLDEQIYINKEEVINKVCDYIANSDFQVLEQTLTPDLYDPFVVKDIIAMLRADKTKNINDVIDACREKIIQKHPRYKQTVTAYKINLTINIAKEKIILAEDMN